jgi:hypothetical protein
MGLRHGVYIATPRNIMAKAMTPSETNQCIQQDINVATVLCRSVISYEKVGNLFRFYSKEGKWEVGSQFWPEGSDNYHIHMWFYPSDGGEDIHTKVSDHKPISMDWFLHSVNSFQQKVNLIHKP